MKSIGEVLQSFLIDYLPVQRGFRASSVKSYRDALRLYLLFASTKERCRIKKLDPLLSRRQRHYIDVKLWRPTRRGSAISHWGIFDNPVSEARQIGF